jgi:hypothetical protein
VHVPSLRRSRYSQSRLEGEWGASSYLSLGVLELAVQHRRRSHAARGNDNIDVFKLTVVDDLDCHTPDRRVIPQLIARKPAHLVPISERIRFAHFPKVHEMDQIGLNVGEVNICFLAHEFQRF